MSELQAKNDAKPESDISSMPRIDDLVEKRGNRICKIFWRLKPTKMGNTTNLFSHLKGYHPSDYTESVSQRAQAGTIPNVRPGDTASVSRFASSASGSGAVVKQHTIASCFTAIAPFEVLSLTVHFIDDKWALHSKCLQTGYFLEDYTGEIISLGLEDSLQSWGLREDRQVCISTDNGANVSLKGWTRL